GSTGVLRQHSPNSVILTPLNVQSMASKARPPKRSFYAQYEEGSRERRHMRFASTPRSARREPLRRASVSACLYALRMTNDLLLRLRDSSLSHANAHPPLRMTD